MHKLFCLMGKSASGKDTVYERLLADESLRLKRVIPYTTRPMREKEIDGETYFFTSEEEYRKRKEEGLILEERAYDTYYGIWRYFTADDGQIDLSENSYLIIGTPEAYRSLAQSLGRDRVVPIYIEVEDGERLLRAIHRERKQETPKYEEMCRRFLADAEDFSEENLSAAGITKRFANPEGRMEECIREVAAWIKEEDGTLS